MVEMERSSRHRSRQRNKSRKAPKVPIKTWRWEDVRRARRRGGYPWTHLYKKPFSEVVDPEQFTMDAFRRAKSSSPTGRVDISEVSSWADYSGKTTPTLLHELINEPLENVSANKASRPGSVVIEEIEDDGQFPKMRDSRAASAGSSVISQYLDQEEPESTTSAKVAKPTSSEETEEDKRKRKKSIESSHSRYSLSQLSVVKKLQEAKRKIKVPKLSFPTKKQKGRKRSSPPKEAKEEKPKKLAKKNAAHRPHQAVKPVYIHIPLKPPPGETDEFSHLEFEPKKEEGHEKPITEEIAQVESQAKEQEKSPKQPLKINPAFKQLLKDVRELGSREQIAEAAANEEPGSPPLEEVETVEESGKLETLLAGQPPSAQTQDANEVQKEEPQIEKNTSDEQESPEGILAPSSEEEQDVENDQDGFDNLFKASASKAGPSKPPLPRAARSRSAEPQAKRRHSLESSYSRKSLSKLALVKKLKDASEKIKSAFSLDTLKRKLSSKKKRKEEEEKAEAEKRKKVKLTGVVKLGQIERPKNVEPVYIHIPLKPPEGQTDEFSHLADEVPVKPEQEVKKEERTDSLDSTSPIVQGDGVQFIFLTPPSDDELLDKDPDIPETPSSDEGVCFTTLKKLAKDAVDHVKPDAKKAALETVSEESASDKVNSDVVEAAREEPPTRNEPIEAQPPEMMVVDVEDGLNEAAKAEDTQLKSAIKSTESAGQKRVSFKRKSRVTKQKPSDKDNGYEIIEPPKEKEAEPLRVEITVDEPAKENSENESSEVHEKIDSQVQDLSASLAESKDHVKEDVLIQENTTEWLIGASDHEYEPISAPDEMTVKLSVVEGDSDPKVIISATDILDAPVEEKKKSFFGRFHKDKGERRKSQSDTESRSSQHQEREDRGKSPNKLQLALKHGAEQIKNKSSQLRDKLHNIKTPEMKKPHFKKPDFKGFKLPKIPDRTTIHLPHISLPGARKTTETRTVETRQYSTESNAGDSEQQPKRNRFDLTFGGTFPRFRKKKAQTNNPEVVFATVPRSKKAPSGFQASSEGSDQPSMEFQQVEIDMDLIRRYSGDDEIDDPALEEKNRRDLNREDFLSRWQHGNFREREEGVSTEEERIIGELVEQRFGKLSAHHGGPGGSETSEERLRRPEDRPHYGHGGPETLEERLRRDEERPRYIEIEEEEFDIRMLEKGHMITDLDNLEEDQGASSEGSGSLRRRGRLGQLDINSDEFFVVHEIQEGFQTPANALAQMNEYDPIGSNRSLPTQPQEPPKKVPIKKPKRKKTPHVSQEEIPGDEESIDGLESPSRPKRRSKRVKKRPDKDDPIVPYQETISLEQGIPHGQRIDFPRESLGILGDDERDDQDLEAYLQRQIVSHMEAQPNAPPRKHRSLKSLTQSENESILMEPERPAAPPRRPGRRSRSSTLSRKSPPPPPRSMFDGEEDGFRRELQEKLEGAASLPQPCVEEPCVQDIRDYMGYAIVDKSKQRDPPLPPPRTPPRRKKRSLEPEQKFATVPRNMREQPPVRPLRNYSTLSHVRDSQRYQNDKENVGQYVEIEDEVNKDLVSGDVIQKMRQRPLPAPPRPPRKPKTSRRSLQDITSHSNILTQEETVSTQTEPLPPDFVCEEIRQEPTDTILVPRDATKQPKQDVVVQRFELYDPRRREVRQELITPTQYSFEETVTHGSLVVRPLDGAQVVPQHQLSTEHIIPVSKEGSEEETSEIPESFRLLRNPESGDEQTKILRADKLQVADLDVERLRVNELVASRIVSSEIDSSTIKTNEISGKEGPVRLADVDLSPEVIEQLLVRQLEAQGPQDVQKKTPTEPQVPEVDVEPPIPPPRGCTLEPFPRTEMLQPEVDDQAPPRPPQPLESSLYLASQPPASFYALRAKQFVDENIPTVPRRKRQHRSRPVSRSHSTSEEGSSAAGGPRRSPRLTRRASEPSISELSGRLIQACGSRINNSLKRLIYHLTENILRNVDGNQDLHVFMIILLVLIAGLILLGYGDERTIVHLHHWEYFNPPRDM